MEPHGHMHTHSNAHRCKCGHVVSKQVNGPNRRFLLYRFWNMQCSCVEMQMFPFSLLTLSLTHACAHTPAHTRPRTHAHMQNSINKFCTIHSFCVSIAHLTGYLRSVWVLVLCVCVWIYVHRLHSPGAVKPLLQYISGFVRAVCLALLPWSQTL